MPQLIELAQNRKITVHESGRRYSVTIPPIPESVWFESFFDAVTATIKCGPGESERQIGVSSALVGLVERMAVECDGYPHLAGVTDWQSKIPLTHRKTYGATLVEALELKGSESSASNGIHAIAIEAVWSGGPGGEMYRHYNLVHHFKTPSVKQRKQFWQAYRDVRRINGVTRRGASVFLAPVQPLAAHALAALYDKLIVKVDGYAVDGEPLGSNRAGIIRAMDTYHKVTAARPLFLRFAARKRGGR